MEERRAESLESYNVLLQMTKQFTDLLSRLEENRAHLDLAAQPSEAPAEDTPWTEVSDSLARPPTMTSVFFRRSSSFNTSSF